MQKHMCDDGMVGRMVKLERFVASGCLVLVVVPELIFTQHNECGQQVPQPSGWKESGDKRAHQWDMN